MRSPQTVSGRVWVEQHFHHLQRWMLSARADEEALREASRALRFLLEREPGYARETRQLALHLAMSTWMAGVPDVIEEVVRVGLDADLMDPELREVPAPAALLLLCLAESRLLEDRRLPGLEAVREASARVAEAPGEDVLAVATRARALVLEGELQELDRERVLAHAAFSGARSALAPLVIDDDQRDRLVGDWTAQVFGPQDESVDASLAGLAEMGRMQLEHAYVGALLGLLRTHDEEDDVAALADETAAAVDRFGLGKAMHPLRIFPAVAALGAESVRLGNALIEAAGRGAGALLERHPVDDLPPELAEVLRASAGEDTEPMRREWHVAVSVAIAAARERHGQLDQADTSYRQCISNAMANRTAVPQAFVIGRYAAFLARHRPEVDPSSMIDLFLTSLDFAHQTDPAAFDDLPLRGLFDDVLGDVIAFEVARDGVLGDLEARRRLSVLLDLLRSRSLPGLLGFAPAQAPGGAGDRSAADDPLADGLAAMANTLDRIAANLEETEGIVALIVQGAGAHHSMLLADAGGLSVHPVPAAFTDAVEALEQAAELAAFQAGAGLDLAGDDPVLPAARAAYDALPDAVRAALADAEVLLVSQEFHGGAAELPIEMLHDGTDYLATSAVVARSTSLRHLARVLDTPAPVAGRRRALVTAAPEGVPSAPLYTAGPERAAVRGLLADAGWDAPDVVAERLDSGFYLDRLAHVDVVHVAAHGESGAGTEYVVLSDGRRLTVDDLLVRTPARLPAAYLNTCRLGRTRYLGGGQARGLAFTLCELGAPAVLANTTDVLDETSAALAAGFYAEALEQPVGWALRDTRRRTVEAGAHPALVARVILFGDPWHTLAGEAEADRASALLDAYFGGEAEAFAAAWDQACAEPSPDARLAAAMDLFRGLDDGRDDEGDAAARVERLGRAAELADMLVHPPAQATMRLARADAAMAAGDVALGRGLLRDAARRLEPLEHEPGPWAGMLAGARAALRRGTLADRGLTPRRMGPGADEPDPQLDAVVDLLFATQQADEDRHGPVRPRAIERTVEDIAYNAVVLGHPNRFEDTADAAAFCRLVARKLVLGGHVAAGSEALLEPMLTGLLWLLWSSQKTAYLEPELAAGQTGAVLALVGDVAGGWPPPAVAQETAEAVGFGERVDAVLADIAKAPWERHHVEVAEQIPPLAEEAEALLDRVASSAPEALAGCAALVTGVLAARNTFSPLEGEDDLHEALTRAVWTLSHGNQGRLHAWLWRGFAPLREAQGDELDRWRAEEAAG